MKNYCKIFGIIALAAVIVFSMAACDDGDDNKPVKKPVDENALDGLWWSKAILEDTSASGLPFVWFFDYPKFWTLDSSGVAQKGTYTLTGVTSGSFTATVTKRKPGTGGWADSSDPAAKGTWSLSANTLTMNVDTPTLTLTLTKTDWHTPENSAANAGPWQDKIGDPDLIIPPPPGWNAEGTVFTLPPFIAQPSTSNIIGFNNASATRDLLKPLVEGAPVAGLFTANSGAQLQILSHNMDGRPTGLQPRVLRTAQYLVFELGQDFPANGFGVNSNYGDTVNKGVITGWAGGTPITPSTGTAHWSSAGGEDFYAVRLNGTLQRGTGWDAVNRLFVIDLELGLDDYAVFAGENEVTPIGTNGVTLNDGQMKLYAGFRQGQGVFQTDFDIKNVYLVNIVK